MSVLGHVLCKYRVDYSQFTFDADQFIRILMVVSDYYEDVVQWDDDYHTQFELNVDILKKASEDQRFDVKDREFIKKLLEDYDTDNDFVRVELF